MARRGRRGSGRPARRRRSGTAPRAARASCGGVGPSRARRAPGAGAARPTGTPRPARGRSDGCPPRGSPCRARPRRYSAPGASVSRGDPGDHDHAVAEVGRPDPVRQRRRARRRATSARPSGARVAADPVEVVADGEGLRRRVRRSSAARSRGRRAGASGSSRVKYWTWVGITDHQRAPMRARHAAAGVGQHQADHAAGREQRARSGRAPRPGRGRCSITSPSTTASELAGRQVGGQQVGGPHVEPRRSRA